MHNYQSDLSVLKKETEMNLKRISIVAPVQCGLNARKSLF